MRSDEKQTFLGLSRVPPHERSWRGTREKPKNEEANENHLIRQDIYHGFLPPFLPTLANYLIRSTSEGQICLL